MFNRNNSQTFNTIKEAKLFLDDYTEYRLPAEEWIVLGKIKEVDSFGQLLPIAVDMKTFM